MNDIFESVYTKAYSSYGPETACYDARKIAQDINDAITKDEIDKLLTYFFVTGVKVKGDDWQHRRMGGVGPVPITNKKVIYSNVESLLKLITENNDISDKSFGLIMTAIKDGRSKNCNFSWLDNFLSRNPNYEISEAHKKTLLSHKYCLPIKRELGGKKVTYAALVKFLKCDGKIAECIKVPSNFIEIVKNNNIKIDGKIFNMFIRSTIIDMTNLIDIFEKCKYTFTKQDCVLMLSHSSINYNVYGTDSTYYYKQTKANNNQVDYDSDCLYDSDASHNSNDSNDSYPKKKVKKAEKAAVQIAPTKTQLELKKQELDKTTALLNKLFDFFKKQKFDTKKIIMEAMYLANTGFLSYLVDSDKISEIGKDIGITCGILMDSKKILDYYTNKKFIATSEHIYLALQCHNGSSSNTTIEYFVQNGAKITADIFEAMVFLKIDGKFEHLCNDITPENKGKLKQQIELINERTSGFRWRGHRKRAKILSDNTAKSEATLIHLCQENSLDDILSYMSSHDITMTSPCFTAMLNNSNVIILEYFMLKYSFKPSVFDIATLPDPTTRYILLKRFYPEHAKVSSFVIKEEEKIITNNNNTDNTDNDIEVEVEVEEKPKKVTKKKIVEVSSEDSDTEVEEKPKKVVKKAVKKVVKKEVIEKVQPKKVIKKLVKKMSDDDEMVDF